MGPSVHQVACLPVLMLHDPFYSSPWADAPLSAVCDRCAARAGRASSRLPSWPIRTMRSGPLLAANYRTVAPSPAFDCRKNERPAAELANQKWGWIATAPSAWAELEVDTTTEVKVGCGCSHATVVSAGWFQCVSIPRRASQAERGSRVFLIASAQLVLRLLPPLLRATWRRRRTM